MGIWAPADSHVVSLGAKGSSGTISKDSIRVYLFANNYQLPNKLLAIYNISACEDKNS